MIFRQILQVFLPLAVIVNLSGGQGHRPVWRVLSCRGPGGFLVGLTNNIRGHGGCRHRHSVGTSRAGGTCRASRAAFSGSGRRGCRGRRGSHSRGKGRRQLRGCAGDGSGRQRRGGVRGWAPGGCLGSGDESCGGRWRRGFTRCDKGWRCRWNRRSVFRAAAASQQEQRQRHHCEYCPGQAVHTHAFTPNPVNSPSQAQRAGAGA